MRLVEAIPAVFMLLLAGTIVLGTSGLNYWDGPTPGSRFFPMILAIAGSAVALLLLWAQWRGLERIDIDLPSPDGQVRVAATVVALFALAIAIPLAGFVPSLAAFMAAMLIVILRQPLLPSIAATIIVAGFVKLVFINWLSVPLPMPLGI